MYCIMYVCVCCLVSLLCSICISHAIMQFSFATSHLLVISLDPRTRALLSLVQQLPVPLPNAATIHRHGPSGKLFIACAGDRDARAGGVQLLYEDTDGTIALGE
jgi:hypothetical protein